MLLTQLQHALAADSLGCYVILACSCIGPRTVLLTQPCIDAALKYQTSSGQWAGPLTAVPELSNYDIQDADELLVIASDGLWDKVSSHQAMLWARDHLKQDASTVESCAKMLVRFCLWPAATRHLVQ